MCLKTTTFVEERDEEKYQVFDVQLRRFLLEQSITN